MGQDSILQRIGNFAIFILPQSAATAEEAVLFAERRGKKGVEANEFIRFTAAARKAKPPFLCALSESFIIKNLYLTFKSSRNTDFDQIKINSAALKT
jgi:hypothetical protein